jgi:hypothetical protein
MKIRFLKIVTALTTCLITATVANAAIITPVYDETKPEYKKYWTTNMKTQVQSACNLIGGYITNKDSNGKDITITLTVTVGDPATMKSVVKDPKDPTKNRKDPKDPTKDLYDYTFATGAIGTGTSTDKTYIASTGTITLNPDPKFFEDTLTKKEWKSNQTSLILHEIIHCLGFSKGIKAFNANIDTTNNTFKGAMVKKFNGGEPFPLNGPNDLSHFKDLTLDKMGVYPRMMAGGGQLLSVVDLAVLSDIGYDLPTIKFNNGAFVCNFALNTAFSSKYTQPQYETLPGNGATEYINGQEGYDTLTNDSSAITALWGKGGGDTLITGAVRTVMFGDDIFTAGAKEYMDTYKITSNAEHLIGGLDAKDKIIIKTGLLTATDISDILVAFTGSYVTSSGKNYYYFKVDIGKKMVGTVTSPKMTVYVLHPFSAIFVDPTNPTKAEITAYKMTYTLATTDIKTRLTACISLGD